MASGGNSDRQSRDTASLEQQVEMLRQQLAQAQKLAAIGELMSTTTHEFNNVLTTIINYAKLGMRHKDQPTRDKSFEKILLAGNRAAKITANILGFARNRSNQQEPTDLAALVDDALLLLEREMVKYRIVVDKQFQPNVPLAQVCGNQIQQIVLNLLINARQAMSNGGRIVIKLQQDPETTMIELTIRDTGKGIAPEHLRRIFDPFFTTKTGPDSSGKGGTGLGLSACRDIIEAHQGRIRVESTVGKGTAFILKLPAAREAVPSPAAIAPPISLTQQTPALSPNELER